METKLRMRLAALGAGFALALSMGTAPALASSAEDNIPAITGDAEHLNVDDIDSTRLGTLEVRLTRKNPYDDLSEPGITDGSTDNYTVTISKVKNVATAGPSADFTQLREMTVAQARNKGLESPRTGTTNNAGVVTFSNLALGMYLIESTPPTTPTANYLKFSPSLVTLPYGDNSSGTAQWGYGLALVPKPIVNTPTPGGNTGGGSIVPGSTPTPSKSATPSQSPTPSTTPTPPEKPLPPLPKGVDPNRVTDPYDIPGWIYDPDKNTYIPNPDDPRVAGVWEQWGLTPPNQSLPARVADALAKTGVQIAGAVTLSAGLIVMGLVLMRRRSSSNEPADSRPTHS
ncbi:adhesin [uncultured Mobiluncus sp.]|uniref:adhesin n=1 Tax=uncultured Mobiluncus sp. TaxID=293425 RepID=UPI0026139260|nr:adhesin [uncultured Mobiluncus sp.]